MRQKIIKAMQIIADRKVNIHPKSATKIELQITVRDLLKDDGNYCTEFDEEYDNMLKDGSLIKVGHTVNKIPLLKLPNINYE
jgi:hypothetical protein